MDLKKVIKHLIYGETPQKFHRNKVINKRTATRKEKTRIMDQVDLINATHEHVNGKSKRKSKLKVKMTLRRTL